MSKVGDMSLSQAHQTWGMDGKGPGSMVGGRDGAGTGSALASIFKMADADGSGDLSAGEQKNLEHLLHLLGANTNGDSKVTIDELKAFLAQDGGAAALQSIAKGGVDANEAALLGALAGDGELDAIDMAMLSRFAKDGKIDANEVAMAKAVQSMPGHGFGENEAQLLHTLMSDGKLDATDMALLARFAKDGKVDAQELAGAKALQNMLGDGKGGKTEQELLKLLMSDGKLDALDMALLGKFMKDGQVSNKELGMAKALLGNGIDTNEQALLKTLMSDGKLDALDLALLAKFSEDGQVDKKELGIAQALQTMEGNGQDPNERALEHNLMDGDEIDDQEEHLLSTCTQDGTISGAEARRA